MNTNKNSLVLPEEQQLDVGRPLAKFIRRITQVLDVNGMTQHACQGKTQAEVDALPQGAAAVAHRLTASSTIKMSITEAVLDQFRDDAPAWFILNALKDRLAEDDDAHRDAFTTETLLTILETEIPVVCVAQVQKLSSMNNLIPNQVIIEEKSLGMSCIAKMQRNKLMRPLAAKLTKLYSCKYISD
jgi:hypothetical protein